MLVFLDTDGHGTWVTGFSGTPRTTATCTGDQGINPSPCFLPQSTAPRAAASRVIFH
jgi:hypothetical protein